MPTPDNTLTLWGGRRGALLPLAEQTVGARVVTPEGRHAMVLSRPGHAVYYGRPGHRIPLDGGLTFVAYDSGAREVRSAGELYAEAWPPVQRQIVAQRIQQRSRRIQIQRMTLPINLKSDHTF